MNYNQNPNTGSGMGVGVGMGMGMGMGMRNMSTSMNMNMRSTMPMGGGGGGGASQGVVDLVLKASCEVCDTSSELYGSPCKHMTLCLSCGKRMARDQERHRCLLCAAPITSLIREYNVRAANPSPSAADKSFSIARFVSGIPPFSRKRSSEVRWSLHRDVPLHLQGQGQGQGQGRQLSDAQKEKLRHRPWVLEDETGQHQFQGHLEGSHSRTATYYLLMLQGREFQAFPAGSWYNFTKVAQYKQLTLEEAEEKMNKRRTNATGYERWMMKAAANGAAAFGVPLSDPAKKPADAAPKDPADPGARGKKPKKGDDLDGEDDRGEEEEEEEAARRDRLGLTKKGAAADDDDDGGGKRDLDLDDDDIEKGKNLVLLLRIQVL